MDEDLSLTELERSLKKQKRTQRRPASGTKITQSFFFAILSVFASLREFFCFSCIVVFVLLLFCHAEAQIATTNNPHGKIKIACGDCHTTKGWSPLRADSKFKHEKTGFALEGQHALIQCKPCHAALKFTETKTACKSCHQDVHDGKLGENCSRCHTINAWQDVSKITFAHQASRFPLRGRHQHVGCDNCHRIANESQFINLPLNCGACHLKDYDTAVNPNHRRAGFSQRCEMCHDRAINGWEISALGNLAGFDHSRTRFPLLGTHAAATCDQCHANNRFAGTPMDCFSCHQTDYQQTTNPNHAASNFSRECQACHNSNNWRPANFDHNKTRFVLQGAHVTVACNQCHVNNRFAGTPSDCFSCHQTDYQKTINPNHVAGNFSRNCQVCHNSSNWRPASFDHNLSRFPLTGAHAAVACDQCHLNNKFTGTSTDCFSCHQNGFQQVANPNHVAANFSHTCTICHTTSGWKPAVFDHNKTRFVLQGAHVTVACNQCHVNNRFAGTPSDCFSCHQTDYQKTTNPNHVAGNFSRNCQVCHNSSNWRPASFDHNLSRFPLTGAHAAVACNQCHVNNIFTGTPTACYSCHQTDFQAARNPNHVAAKFSQTCTDCHITAAWKPATFDHTKTRFPLLGAHATTACNQCHVNNIFAGTPTNCYSCHQADYQNTKNPNHVASNFSQTCQTCHNNNAWRPASYDHNLSRFPLTGAHLAVACNQCHVNNIFMGTPTACYSCHQTDFQAARNPNHVAAKFSQTCTDCHTTSAWKPSTFNHNTTAFPLLGAHVTVACIQCHVNNIYKGTPTLCYSCHQSDYQNTVNPNHVAAKFSQTCTDCHTVNAWKPATFDHNTTGFLLQGAHVAVACNQCHVNNIYAGTPTDCYSCHQSDYQNTNNPNHVAANFPRTCTSCHTVNAWTPATFNHDAQYFPIYSGKHEDEWQSCSACHVNPADYKVFECVFCHAHVQKEMADKHKDVSGYQYSSPACYSCHPDGEK